jgi:HK97 family phage major capsid protein/HK97 family phage prohead protease
VSYPDASLETRLSVKSLDVERRTFRGMATTPDLDRQGHHVDPLGATFRNPLPLLWQHDQTKPIGTVTFFPPTAAGIAFEASLPTVETAGALKDRIDEAWQSITAGIVAGVSIGFRVLEDGVERLKGGVLKLTKTEIVELSLVTIGANPHATIHLVKSLAAFGPGLPGGPGSIALVGPKAPARMTIPEQITAAEAKRAAQVAAMSNLMQSAADTGTTLDADQSTQYDDLALSVKSLDDHLTRYRELEQLNLKAATPIVAAKGQAVPFVRVTPNQPPGTTFVRAAIAMLRANGDHGLSLEYAKQYKDSPDVELFLKAATAPGTTTDATWAGPLAVYTNARNEFIELLRPATLLGKIPGLRQVPFNTQVPIQSAGGLYQWVGQGKAKPVGKLAFSSAQLGIAKAAGIIVMTEELVRVSSPSAEAIVRNDMIKGIAQFLDQQFIDPAVAPVAGVSPGSITNGVTPIAATVSPLKDIAALLGALSTANIPLAGVVLIMSETNAFALGLVRTTNGVRLFPDVGATGGSIDGITVLTSNVAGTNVIAAQPNLILYADDGGVAIDVSREASLQMDTVPMNPPDATVVMTSLWQENLVGLRAERFINWLRPILTSVAFVQSAVYTPSSVEANGGPLAAKGKA